MELNKTFVKNSNVLASGTTSYIMTSENGITYKLYKATLDYICNDGEYQLDKENVLERLNYIISKKNDVLLTCLPNDILMYKGNPVGVQITYFDNSITLEEYLINNKDVDLLQLKQQLLKIVEELIQNGIIPTDPNFKNFLVCFDEMGKRKINMVDVDDVYVSIYPDNKRDVWYESEVFACYRCIDLSFDNLGYKIR